MLVVYISFLSTKQTPHALFNFLPSISTFIYCIAFVVGSCRANIVLIAILDSLVLSPSFSLSLLPKIYYSFYRNRHSVPFLLFSIFPARATDSFLISAFFFLSFSFRLFQQYHLIYQYEMLYYFPAYCPRYHMRYKALQSISFINGSNIFNVECLYAQWLLALNWFLLHRKRVAVCSLCCVIVLIVLLWLFERDCFLLFHLSIELFWIAFALNVSYSWAISMHRFCE